MGQNSSRQRRTAFTSSSTTDPSPPPPEQDSESTAVSLPRRSRRQSVRRSILNLVKPSVRVDSPAGSPRKSWRNSRRWSKASPELQSHAESSQSAGSSTVPPSPINEKGKGVDRDPDALSIEEPAEGSDRPSSSSSPILEEATTDVTETTVADAEGAEDQAATEGAIQTPAHPESDDQDEVVISPDPTLDSTPPAPQVESAQDGSADSPAPAAQQNPAHQFPPPGTLVVVQGVVHTTDVPRPSAPSAPQPEVPESTPRSSSTPPTTRNRLSTLLQSRPGSIVGSRPASAIGSLPPSNNQTSTTLDATTTSDGLQADPVQPHTDLPNPSAHTPTPPTQTPPSNDGPSGAISSGSIDVLGTLLSVAAAATAASLLTGTSQPLLLPSSLGPPVYNAEPTATATTTPVGSPGPSEPATSRPTSPTPTAGLGLDASRAERLRQAWGSIRERLGLRPAPPPSSTPASASGSEMDLSATSPTGDPREHLFGQMARAFNLGLGLASESAAAPSSASATATAPRNGEDEQAGAGAAASDQARQPPAEGSFERFLIDLQTDLRVALTSTNDPPADTTTSGESESEPAEASAPRSFAAPSTDHGDEDNTEDEEDEEMPPLGDISDSDSEFGDAHDEESEASDEGVPVTPVSSPDAGPSRMPRADQRGESAEDSSTSTMNSPGAAGANTSTTQGSIPEVDAEGRINWWRLYRFPPIAIPPTQGIPAAVATPFPSGRAAPATTSSPSPTSASLAMDPTLSELPFANSDPPSPQPQASPQPRPYSVVPVIVVGVQSVNANWQMQPPTDEDQDGGEEATDVPFDGEATGAQPRTRGGRGRGWHSRAAEAIRNLRPGRRNRNAAPANTPGSRTFLIYVIGGYYPPNHSILNGGPDTLASLEALLELADLLGHAKPPTVTKEEIEKSGLEIIKSTQLEQYEKEEKISSNCTERCLICLDEYQVEDDIRVMKCRHAFHQNCVDKWLETGRNNCPACRSKGVSVDDT